MVRALLFSLLSAGDAGAKVNILGYWWENPLPFERTPSGLPSPRAADCGACHAEIYREWQLSPHAHALSDRQFQAEMTKSPETRWLCLNCHTPLENQRAEFAVAVRRQSPREPVFARNPRYDARLEREAVTCAVCHVRDGYVLGPAGDIRAPHPVKRDPRLLTADICAACHQAVAKYTDTLVCNLDTAAEWRASSYAVQGRTCAHCHMPAVTRPLAPGGPRRAGRRHYFAGSMIPKEYDRVAPGRALNPGNLFRSGLTVEIAGSRREQRDLVVSLRLKNAYAGHWLPTGDPERSLKIDVRLLAGGKPAGDASLRLGQVWKWWPKAEKLSDNRLKPLEERLERLRFPGAARAAAPGVEITVTNVRMTGEAAAYHKLAGKHPTHAVVTRFRRELPQP